MCKPRIAAVRYAPGQNVHAILNAFIIDLKAAHVDVHGVIQKPHANGGNLDAIDIRTAICIPLKRPTQYEMDNGVCSLDLSQLAEASMILRRALEQNAAVVVVERFGKIERNGGGLAADLLQVMAAGLPTVVSVPEEELKAWDTFSGGLGVVMPCELNALRQWWSSLSS